MSQHGHPSARERHEAAALERVLARGARRVEDAERRVADLAGHEQLVREAERGRIVGVLVQDAVETDFEGCVG